MVYQSGLPIGGRTVISRTTRHAPGAHPVTHEDDAKLRDSSIGALEVGFLKLTSKHRRALRISAKYFRNSGLADLRGAMIGVETPQEMERVVAVMLPGHASGLREASRLIGRQG